MIPFLDYQSYQSSLMLVIVQNYILKRLVQDQKKIYILIMYKFNYNLLEQYRQNDLAHM